MTGPTWSSAASEKARSPAEFLRTALETVTEPGAIAIVTVPAPLAPLETLMEFAPDEDALLWQPAEGPSFSAFGAVAALPGAGPERTEHVRRRAEALWPRLTSFVQGDAAPPAPRCFGGFAFRPGWAAAEPWTAFGDARFFLPRFRYARLGELAWLSVAVRGDEAMTEAARDGLVTAVEALLAALLAANARLGLPARGRAGPRTVTAREETLPSEWGDRVSAIVRRIERGDFAKVVLARRLSLTFDVPIDVTEVLSELLNAANHCTRFAFRFEGTSFVGATPERLVRRHGLSLDTEALAGSNRVGGASRGAEMMDSPKEREEHELVVQEIVKGLSPLCATLTVPRAPEVHVLRHLIHLKTPIRAQLSRPVHVLELVERLHPTPAVGGVPSAAAQRFITEHEPAERGWYASPIGWFDAAGDGEFFVGLRSGAFVGPRAYLYAGCGIVRDSSADGEYAETRLKLRTLCAALHVSE